MNQKNQLVLGSFVILGYLVTFVTYQYLPQFAFILLACLPLVHGFQVEKSTIQNVIGVAFIAILIPFLINFQKGFIFLSSTLITSLIFGYCLKKKKSNSEQFLFTLIGSLLSFFLMSYLCKPLFSLDQNKTLLYFFQFLDSSDTSNLLPYLLYFTLAQVSVTFFGSKLFIDKKTKKLFKNPFPNWWMVGGGLILPILIFFGSKNQSTITFLSILLAFIWLPVTYYGYSKSEKIWILVISQLIAFLVLSLPLLVIYNKTLNYQIFSYILIFLPVFGYGCYEFIKIRFEASKKG